MMRSTPAYPPGGIRVPSSFSRVVQVFETQSRIAPTGQAAALLRNVAANLVDDLVAAVRGQVGQFSLEPLQIFVHQLRGMRCGHHGFTPFRKMLSTESRNLNHSSRNCATAF